MIKFFLLVLFVNTLTACVSTASQDVTPVLKGVSFKSDAGELLLGDWNCQSRHDNIKIKYTSNIGSNTYKNLGQIQLNLRADQWFEVGTLEKGTWRLDKQGRIKSMSDGNTVLFPLDRRPDIVALVAMMQETINEDVESRSSEAIFEIMKLTEKYLILNEVSPSDENLENFIVYCQRKNK